MSEKGQSHMFADIFSSTDEITQNTCHPVPLCWDQRPKKKNKMLAGHGADMSRSSSKRYTCWDVFFNLH